MDIVRRNTDYALRAMLNLAGHYGNEPVSSRDLAQKGQIPYQLMCKLMQKLHNAELVKSIMGPHGGFRLNKKPAKISLLEVIEAIQGTVKLNRCLLGRDICIFQKRCEVRKKLAELEDFMNSYLGSITLDKLVSEEVLHPKKRYKRIRK